MPDEVDPSIPYDAADSADAPLIPDYVDADAAPIRDGHPATSGVDAPMTRLADSLMAPGADPSRVVLLQGVCWLYSSTCWANQSAFMR